MVRRWQPLLIASIVTLLAIPASAAPWFQYGGADGWNFTPDPGPATDDIAWRFNLGGSRAVFAPPLIIGDWAYSLESSGPVAVNGSQPRLHRISLDTGDHSVFASFSQVVFAMASDGERMFVAGADSLLVVNLADGSILRELEYPDGGVVNRYQTLCLLLRVDMPRLYVYCVITGNRVQQSRGVYDHFGRPFRDLGTLADGATTSVAVVAAYDVERGVREWERFIDASTHAEQSGPASDEPGQLFGNTGLLPIVMPTGLALIEDFVVVTGGYWEGFRDVTTRSHMEGHCFLTLLNHTNGNVVKRFTSLDDEYLEASGSATKPLSCVLAGEPRGDANIMFGKFQRAFTIDLVNMGYLKTERLEGGEDETGSGAAYDGEHAYMGSWKKIYKFNAELLAQDTFLIPADTPDAIVDYSPLLTPTTLYLMTHDDRDGQWQERGALYALNADDMTLRWRMELPHGADSIYGLNHLHSVGEGLLIMAGADGSVIAIGNTAASPKPIAALSDVYPALNASVEIDLSRSEAGAGGPPTQFRAEWGDGAVTDWQGSPILSHSYAQAPSSGEGYSVRLQVRNQAGQSASEFLQVHAGGVPPLPPQTSVPLAGGGVAAAASEDGWSTTWSAVLAALAALVVIPIVVMLTRTRQRVAAVYQIVEGRAAKRFEVMRELGRGTYGVAQLARDTHLDRFVVLKQPYGSSKMSESQRNRFLREARLAARVQHPNVVTVFEVLPDQDPPVMVLEYGAGGSVEALLQTQHSLAPANARELTMDILQGLAAIHSAGLVHRDLKPSNVILDAQGRAKVSDFGIAVPLVQPSSDETMAFGGATLGTIAYMSPERLRGAPATELSDLYAAAAIAYRMFTGRHHADGRDQSPEAVRRRILKARPSLKDEPAVPRGLQPVLQRALANEPSKRYPDVKTFLAEFGAASLRGGGPR